MTPERKFQSRDITRDWCFGCPAGASVSVGLPRNCRVVGGADGVLGDIYYKW